MIGEIGLLLCLSAAAPPASGGSDDFLYVSGEADDVSPGGGGGSGGALWTHRLSSRWTTEAGGYAYALEGTSWAYGKIGTTMTLSQRAIAHVDASVGGGSQEGSDIDYQLYRGSLSLEVVSRRLWADVESQYIRFGESHGSLLKLGAVVAPRPAFSGRLAYYVSTSGNLGARFWSGRLDLQRRSLGYFVGLSLGRSRPELVHDFTTPAVVVDSTEVYGGVRFPAGPHEITAYVDSVGVEGTRRTGFALMFKLRL